MAQMPRQLPKIIARKRWPSFILKTKGKRELYFTQAFEKYVKTNKINITEALKFILRNRSKINENSLIDPKTGIAIKKAFTGEYQGRKDTLTFKVTYDGREFFLKLNPQFRDQERIQAYKGLEIMLAKMGHKVGRYKVAVLRPHLIYTNAHDKGYSALVSDFFNENEVVQLNRSDEIFLKFAAECTQLNSTAIREKLYDVRRHNMFFHKKSKTILIFDPS